MNNNQLNIGLSYTASQEVTAQNTAQAMGSGDMPVLATPSMIALMENAAMLAVAPTLPEGDTTVGTLMNATHDRPSPVGATITATATLTEIDGRKLTFAIEAYDNSGQRIGTARHQRFIVTRQRFLDKLNSSDR